MSKRDAYKDFLDYLIGDGLTEYGSIIPNELVYQLLKLQVPEVGTMKEFSAISLKVLAATDYVRNYLLGHGKYLLGTPSGYRILMPSENAEQVEAYMSSADGKLNRALKLSRNTPREPDEKADQIQARILMKKEGIRQRRQ
jgi:hypothetical protein